MGLTHVWEISDTAEPKAISPASHSIPHPVGDKGGIKGKALRQTQGQKAGGERDGCEELATETFRV